MVTMNPALTKVVTIVDDDSSVGDSDGAQSGAIPVVAWAYATIGHPLSGGLPGGTNTLPVTCSVPPVMPDVEEEDLEDPVLTMPQGRRFRRDLDELSAYTDEEPYMVAVLPSPPAALAWDGGRFSCWPQNGTHLGAVIIEDYADRAPYWRSTVFGPLQPFLDPPSFPSDWGWSGVPADGLLLRAWTAKLSIDPNELRYVDFAGAVNDTAHAAAAILEE